MAGEFLWPFVTPGIPDEQFRGRAGGDAPASGNKEDGVWSPLTKEEVRVLALSKARLRADSTVYDIGAGTGSIAIEAAALARLGRVYAVERDPVRAGLCRENAMRFGIANLDVVCGEAPGALEYLPEPDRVFVGGSGGQLSGILDTVGRRLRPGGRLVVLAVTLDTLCDSVARLKGLGYAVEAVQVSLARLRPLASHLAWQGLNPVHVIAAERPAENDARGGTATV